MSWSRLLGSTPAWLARSSRPPRLVLFAATLALVSSWPVAAAASVPDSYGFGSRSAAMAGAVGGDSHDFSSVYYNPAGLVEAPAVSVAVGYMYNAQHLLVDGLDNEVDNVHGLVAGLVAPGSLFGLPFAFGLAVHLPDDGLSYINARRQGVPRWELYDTRAQLLYLAVDLAVRPLSWLELGGGIAFLSATRGTFAIRGRADVIRPFDSELEHEVDADLTAVRFPQAGLRLLWEGWGALGVTYRGESKLDLAIDAHLEGIVEFAGIDVPLLYDLEARTISAFTPQQLNFGLSFQRIENVHINFDLSWLNWSAYQSPTAKIVAKLEAHPPPGTPVELPGEPAPTKIVAPEFSDRLVPRIGLEWRVQAGGAMRQVHGEQRPLVELPVRMGYVFESSPVPDQGGVTNLIDADRHTFTLGIGAALNRPVEEIPGSLRLDLHAFWSFFPPRELFKDNPADFVGDYKASGEIFGGGGNLEVVF